MAHVILAVLTILGLGLAFYGDIIVNIPLMLTGIGIVITGVIIWSIMLPPTGSSDTDESESTAPDR